MGVHVDVFTTDCHIKSLGPPLFYVKNAFLKLKAYDIVHSNEGAGILVDHPHMVETYHHDYKTMRDLDSLVFSKLENYQCKKVQQIIVPSLKTKEVLLRDGFGEKKIAVIPHGVDTSVFRRMGVSKSLLKRKYGLHGYFVAMNVGQLVARKRQVDIVRSLSGLPSVALIIVGKGAEESAIKKTARQTKVKLVHFESISDEKLVELYNAADVYVNASALEGFGLTILEAMACGLPIIAYDAADFELLIGNSGFLLRNGHMQEMGTVVEMVRENAELRQQMGHSALAKSKDYSWRNTANKHLEIYQKL
jgi:glycosyltransferase involved in cell wall biosynthesis